MEEFLFKQTNIFGNVSFIMSCILILVLTNILRQDIQCLLKMSINKINKIGVTKIGLFQYNVFNPSNGQNYSIV